MPGRLPIESPCGAWIVGFRTHEDFSDPSIVIQAYDEAGRVVERLDVDEEQRRIEAVMRGGPSPELVEHMLLRIEASGDDVLLRDAQDRAATMEPSEWLAWFHSHMSDRGDDQ